MRQFSWIVGGVFGAWMSVVSIPTFAQAKVTSVPDAQVESDVLRALAANTTLADQTISSSTVYGTVTLSGSVRDEESRKLAETIVSHTRGVQKVIDELTLRTDSAQASQNTTPANPSVASGGNPGEGDSTPLLQSDGTIAPATGSPANPDQSSATQPSYSQQQQPSYEQPYGQPGSDQPQVAADGRPQQPINPPYGQQPENQPSQPAYGVPQAGQGQYGQPQYGQNEPDPPQPAQPQYGQNQPVQPPYTQNGQPPYSQPQYGSPSGDPRLQSPRPYGAQLGGMPVTLPTGSTLRIRINQGLDSNHAQPGAVFDAVVLNDVVAGGYIAIPRGANVQGTVVEAERAGAFKGRGELALQLTQVTLAGRTYPISSDLWSNVGADKTTRTVNSALGLGAVGAIIGGAAGGGAGAAIGAGLGGAAGVGASAASGGGQAFIPSEAILTFHLTQQAELATLSQAEIDRLGYGMPAGAPIRRRYVRPSPYGYPAYYPRPIYPYVYYR